MRTHSDTTLRLCTPFVCDDACDDATTTSVATATATHARHAPAGRERTGDGDTCHCNDNNTATSPLPAQRAIELAGLCDVAQHVWGALGLCKLPRRARDSHTRRAAPTSAAATTGHRADATSSDDDDDDDTQMYVQLLHELYDDKATRRQHTQPRAPPQPRDDDDSVVVVAQCSCKARYALWWLLCNAAYYCAAMAAATRARGHRDADDMYALVRLARAAQQHGAHDKDEDSSNSGNSSSDGCTLPAADWRACLRHLARLGYRRARVYTQTPAHASAHELLLALLWLTQRCQLVVAAEYVTLSRQCHCLLRYTPRNDDAAHATATTTATTREARLLAAFPRATPWPPAGYDEDATIARRLALVDSILGDAHAPSRGAATTTTTPATHVATMLTRRVLTLHRVIAVALARLEHALQQRAEQVVALGLHSALDAQLCQSRDGATDGTAVYARLVAGLQRVCTCEERVQQRLRSLRAAGALVASALQHERAHAASSSPARWLRRRVVAAAVHADAEAHTASSSSSLATTHPVTADTPQLDSVLSTFAATHTRESLDDAWRTLLRRRRYGTCGSRHDSAHGVADADDGNGVLDSAAARDAAVTRVRRSMYVQYSLQSSLAAELLLLLRRRRCSARRQQQGARGAVARRDVGDVVRVAPLLTFATHHDTHAHAAAATTRASVLRASNMAQPTEVGTPAAHETTSARVEAARLTRLLRLMAEQPVVQQQRHTRAARARAALQQLRDMHGLRVVDWHTDAPTTTTS